MGVIWSNFLIWWYKKGSAKKQQQITILTFNLSRTRKQKLFLFPWKKVISETPLVILFWEFLKYLRPL